MKIEKTTPPQSSFPVKTESVKQLDSELKEVKKETGDSFEKQKLNSYQQKLSDLTRKARSYLLQQSSPKTAGSGKGSGSKGVAQNQKPTQGTGKSGKK